MARVVSLDDIDNQGDFPFPAVLKAQGLAHKSDEGGVALNLTSLGAVKSAAQNMGRDSFLMEQMITGAVCEILIGVVADPAHGFVLTLAAGGVMTEILKDSTTLVLPVTSRQDVDSRPIQRLKIAPILNGYRGQPAVDMAALVDAVMSVQSYVQQNMNDVLEVEINPIIATPTTRNRGRCTDQESDMSDSPIKTERCGHVLEVTLDRPKANAIDLATSRIMGDVFRDFRDDPELRVAILTGGGEKFFCPGWDLKAAAEGDAVDGDYGVGGFGGLQELRGMNKPVIAAVNGIACGGGLELALSADIILSADHSTFALPEIRSGTVADAASVKLPKRIPYHIAMELLLTGRWFDAEEAKGWGIINHIYPTADLMAEARKLAKLLASGPPLVYGRDQGNRARG